MTSLSYEAAEETSGGRIAKVRSRAPGSGVCLALEWRKMKRTGLLPAFLGGGLLTALLPVVNMAVRSEQYLRQILVSGDAPVKVLLDANWQMMAMMNLLLAVTGACIVYHAETADNALDRMAALPVGEGRMFAEKWILLAADVSLMILMEEAAIGFCCGRWFGESVQVFAGYAEWLPALARSAACACLLVYPAVALSLAVASLFRNMWLPLGIGVVCVALAVMFPEGNGAAFLFPFSMALRVPCGVTGREMAAALAEILALLSAGILSVKLRRWFS